VNKENVFEDDPPLPAPIPESPLTKDLNEQEKIEFARLLKKKMSLNQRADALVALAKMTDTKRAPVGLRAIQEINKITGISQDDREETAPMFVLPPNTKVAIMTETPEE